MDYNNENNNIGEQSSENKTPEYQPPVNNVGPQEPAQTEYQPVGPQEPVQTGYQPVGPQEPVQTGYQPVGPQEPVQTGYQPVQVGETVPGNWQHQVIEPPVKIKKEKKKLSYVGKLVLALILCGTISFSAAVGGFYIANDFSFGITGDTVLYQSVSLTDEDGNSLDGLSTSEVVEITADSVVEIFTETVSSSSIFGQEVTSGAGSGVVISEDGYIVTNNHVIEGTSEIYVRLTNGEEYSAVLIGTDSETDLAVIKIEATDLTVAVLGSSDSVQVGDTVVAIGNPLGELGGTVTEGIISALDRELTIDGETMTLLQTDAAINPGNSGGGLFNDSGELIGIVNAKSVGDEIEGLAYAIPVDVVKEVVEELIENGYVSGRPAIGISLVEILDSETASMYGVSYTGVYVYSSTNEALLSGDLIISIDGESIDEAQEIIDIVDAHEVGDVLEMQIYRSGTEMTVYVTLVEDK